MDINIILTIVFGLIGAGGLGASIYYGKKSAALERSKLSIDFEDLNVAASDISDYVKSIKFIPDIIYTPGAKCGNLAELVSQKFTVEPLVVVGVLQWKDSGLHQVNHSTCDAIECNKWRILIPHLLQENKTKKILIVDDIAMSGDGLSAIINALINGGIDASNIKSATLVCTSVAISSKKNPDYCWKKTDGTTYYFPWGKTR